KTRWAKKHLNGFLLGQLNFRVYNYTRMLTIVSLLFAMALGAITVGSGYHRQLPMMANSLGTYTIAVHNKTAQEQRLIDQLNVKHQATYTQKRQGKVVYYNAAELQRQPFELNKGTTEAKYATHPKYYTESLKQFKKGGSQSLDFLSLAIRSEQGFYAPQFLSARQFAKQP